MEGWILAAVIGGSLISAVVVGVRQRKKNALLVPRILEQLRDQERTLPELATEMGMGGFLGRGKVAMALNQLVTEGALSVVDAPAGTPQLEKVNLIRYRVEQPG